MNLNFKQIKKSTLSDSIVQQIIEMISAGNILPGERLPSERDLAEALSVSRPSIREAMRSLHALGLIEIRTGDGTYLNENIGQLSDFRVKNILKKYSMLELTEARKLLEVEIVALAAERATEQDKENIKEAFQNTLKYPDDPKGFLKADFEYHMTIAEAAQNQFLAEMLYTTRDLMVDGYQDVVRLPGKGDKLREYHNSIMDAVLAGDKKKAQKVMEAHLEDIIQDVYKTYNNTN